MFGKYARALMGAAIAFAVAGCGYRESVPPAQADAAKAERDLQAFVESLNPHRSDRPVIAVVALNESTETTDFLLTHAVLRRAGVADVLAVAPRAGRVSLYPALEIDGVLDFAAFDTARGASGVQGTPRMPLAPALKAVQQLDRTLCEIAERFGAERREWVMMELEYPTAANAGAPLTADVTLS